MFLVAQQVVSRPADGEWVGEVDGQFGAGVAGYLDRVLDRVDLVRRVPDVAGREEDARPPDVVFGYVLGAVLAADAEVGVHRPLTVGGDQDHGGSGHTVDVGQAVAHPARLEAVLEQPARVVVGDR